jgi:hypothetical protein
MFDFPTTPAIGTTVTNTSGYEYKWDGTKWTSVGGGPVAVAPPGGVAEAPGDAILRGRQGSTNSWLPVLYVGDTSPPSPWNGAFWFDSLTSQLFVYYNDGNSSQWVIANAMPETASGSGGATLTVSDTAPTAPTVGQLWFDSVGIALYVWYNDGTSSQWVVANSGASAGAANGTVTQINTGVGLVGGPITAAGTILMANTAVTPGSYRTANITIDAQGRITSAAGGIAIALSTSPAPATTGVPEGELWWDSAGMQLYILHSGVWVVAVNQSGYVIDAPADGNAYARRNASWAAITFPLLGGVATYAQLPAAVQHVPLSFPFVGKPVASQLVNVPMGMAMTVPVSLAGTRVFATTAASGTPSFILNKISGGSTTAMGTIQFVSGSQTAATLTGAGGSLAAGDTLQLVAPPSPDSALADIGITVLANRV